MAMEGIRGFAVFLVFLVHYVTLVTPWIDEESVTYAISAQLISLGNVGVDLFFVLSGYLIYGMLITKEKPFLNYLRRRIQRIYPVFTVVFLIYLALSWAFPAESKIPAGWEGVLFVMQNYVLLPGLFDVKAIITVAWSLSYEFFYYLVMPLIIAVFRLRHWPAGSRVVFFVVASALLFPVFSIYDGPVRLLMFMSGIILFEIVSRGLEKPMPPIGIPALVVALAGVAALNAFDAVGWWKYLMLYVLFLVFCLECFVSAGAASRLFSASPLRWLGNMSYSYYLIHGLALKFVFLVLAKIHPALGVDVGVFWGLMPLAFLVSLVPAAVLFIYIEKPYSLARRA